MPAHQNPTATRKQQPLLTKEIRRSRIGETAGECAAVCCCFPCAMVHVVLLAVYRVPTSLWRRKKRNRLLRKKKKLDEKRKRRNSFGDFYDNNNTTEEDGGLEMEDEIWGRFYGFWRSGSKRKDDDDDDDESSLD